MNTSHWSKRLGFLADNHLERQMRVLHSPVGPVTRTGDGDKLNFSSNDYLGFATHPQIKKAMADAASVWGGGAASSRLVAGNTSIHHAFEEELADYMETEDAVLFPSGYQANVGALVALTEPGDMIFSDALVHASLVDGCRLSRAEVHIFPHRDTNSLNLLLSKHQTPGLKLIITDSVFSMDGDFAPVEDISDLARKHEALVYIDEAHALGVLGPSGRGLAAERRLAADIAVRVGTFGKAFGTAGAFVAAERSAAGLIRSRARSLLYTTAAPPPIIAASRTSLGIVREADKERVVLKRNITHFTSRAAALGIPLMPSTTAIQPVPVGPAEKVVKSSQRLWDRGLFVQGMRPPTVPVGSSRLRVTLTAAHSYDQIEQLLAGLSEALTERETGV